MMPDVDGGLVGGASLDSRGFTDIVSRFNRKALYYFRIPSNPLGIFYFVGV